jgi:hypothetical protein
VTRMPYVPSAETIEAFTEGDCWRLAKALRKITGLPLVFANPHQLTNRCERVLGLEYWEHVGLLVDEETVLDINGLTPVWDWAKKWAGAEHRYFFTDRDDDIAVLLEDQDHMYPATHPARPARRLVETHLTDA